MTPVRFLLVRFCAEDKALGYSRIIELTETLAALQSPVYPLPRLLRELLRSQSHELLNSTLILIRKVVSR